MLQTILQPPCVPGCPTSDPGIWACLSHHLRMHRITEFVGALASSTTCRSILGSSAAEDARCTEHGRMPAPHTAPRHTTSDQRKHFLYISIIALQCVLLLWLATVQPHHHKGASIHLLPGSDHSQQQQQRPQQQQLVGVQHSTPDSTSSATTGCQLERREYISSALEQEWLDHVGQWQNNYCQAANIDAPAVATWLTTAAALNPPGAPRPPASSQQPDPAVFSRYVSSYTCASDTSSSSGSGSSTRNQAGVSRVTHTTWIEPLAYGLRHPKALCGPAAGEYLLDKTYLVLATAADHAATSLHQPCSGRSCQRLYFDLGAGTFKDSAAAGNHPNSQGWMYDAFKRGGLEFDRLLLWEATVINDTVLLGMVPPQLQYKYQYFNIPVGLDPSAPNHPLQMLRALAQPGDFVVFKLDLDNSAVETAVIRELLKDPDLLGLIDSFMFEYHVNFQDMIAAGWAGHTVSPDSDLTDAYALFLKLRQCGVRAHSWV